MYFFTKKKKSFVDLFTFVVRFVSVLRGNNKKSHTMQLKD